MYVLTPAEVARDVAADSPNPLTAAVAEKTRFAVWAFVGVVVVSIIFFFSISRRLERTLDPWLLRLKRFAPLIARLTLGTSLLASGYFGSLFGPELPLRVVLGGLTIDVRWLITLVGFLILIGFWSRLAAGIMAAVFLVFAGFYDFYMLNYLTYVGVAAIILAVGSHAFSLDHFFTPVKRADEFLTHHQYLILRIFFGISLIYASLYAKFWHSQLALDTVTKYHLTDYFPFAPLFLVLGASIIELLIGVFIIVGIELRFTALFFMVFLTLSVLYFGEAVWPHLILYGTALVVFTHGYDRYTLEGYYFKRGSAEPVF